MSAREKTQRVLIINKFLSLILSLAVLGLCLIPVSVKVFAAESDRYLYNGVDLPDINSFWTDKVTYPYAAVLYYSDANVYYFMLSQHEPFYFKDDGKLLCQRNESIKWVLGCCESPYSEIVFSNSGDASWFILGDLIWASFDAYLGKKVSGTSVSTGTLFLAKSDPIPVTAGGVTSAEYPSITQNLPAGGSFTYQQNDIAQTLNVAATVLDGGSLSYTWFKNTFLNEGAPVTEQVATGQTYTPATDQLGKFSYYCQIENENNGYYASVYSNVVTITVVEQTDSTVPINPPEPTLPSADEIGSAVGDAFEGSQEQEKQSASDTGSDLVDQLTGVIPDYSEGFTTALTDFASNFSYDGTEAILRIPQIRFPEIPSNRRGTPLVRSFVMLEEQEVDFSEFAAMMPESVLTLVRCLLTVALIIFCFKELYDTISYILTLRKGDN